MADAELQAKLLKEAIEAAEKKRKLEEDIKSGEARTKLFLENAARKDIEAYKKGASVEKNEN
jgi:hypothetical protein